eukprot:2945370-Prymnesium_polylepis.1
MLACCVALTALALEPCAHRGSGLTAEGDTVPETSARAARAGQSDCVFVHEFVSERGDMGTTQTSEESRSWADGGGD